MRIQHNIMAMNAYRNYNNNTSALAKNLEKLSSGYKINRAGDDAAGLAISEKMRAQITGLKQAQANAKSGINLIQTAEGATTEIHDMLNRMVKLADQSANGTYDDGVDRVQLQKELNQLRSEVDRIADATNFNGIKLLDGSLDEKGMEGAKEPGDYIMLDAGNNEITLLKNQQINDGTKSAFTLAGGGVAGDTAGFNKIVGATADENGFTFDVRYIDESGAEQTKTITVAPGVALADGDAVAGKINDEIVNAKIGFEAGATKTDTANILQSATKGSTGAQLLGITLRSYGTKTDGTGTVTIKDDQLKEITVDKTKTIQGKDKDMSNKISFANDFKEGDTVTIGDKTYEFVAPAAMNSLKNGNVAVAIGLNADGEMEQDSTMNNLVNAMVANGVGARVDESDTNHKTILVDDLADISIKRDHIDVDVKSDAITTGNSNATKGAWQFEVGAGTAGDTYLTVKYLDTDGKEQQRRIKYTGDTDADSNAAAIMGAINGDEVLNKLFKAEQIKADGTVAAGPDVRITAMKAGANAGKVLGIVSEDAATTSVGAAAAAGTFRQISEGKDAAAGFVLGDNVKAGDTVQVAGKTFEFVKEGDVGKVADGNLAVVIGSDGKKTAANFNEALKDAGFTTSYLKDTAAVRVVENEFSLGTANKVGKGGGLTLQIGDTSDDFNQLRVTISDMHTKALGIGDLDISNQTGAADAVKKLKDAINQVSDTRGTLGATQNRLDHTINNLSVMEENIQDAESSIRDTDVADEMMAYTKNNILIQSAQAMLAQANQVPQGVLQLLQ